MKSTLRDQLRALDARNAEYRRQGHDRRAATRFVVDAAGELWGPVLDVGTGKGGLARELARRGLEVLSVDVGDDDRELARHLAGEEGLAGRVAFEHCDAARLPHADGRFGCVATMDVLHHLLEPEPALREMARVVAVGGKVVLADFDEQGFELVARVLRAEGREHPRSATTLSWATEWLLSAGFSCLARSHAHQHDVAVLQKQAGAR